MNKKWFFWAGLILGACPLLCGNTDLPKDPDIALKEIRLIPASPLLYEAPVVKVALANAGTEELPEVPLTLLWKLTKRGASRPLKEQGCSADFTKLAPGEVREITAEYIQFWPSEPGDYTLRVELSLGGVLLGLEKKLENNAGTVDFTVGPGEKSDIIVTRIGFNPPSPAKDVPFWIEAEAKNVGKGTVTNISARTRIYKAGVMIMEKTQGSTSTYRTGATTSIRTLVDPGLPAGQYQIEVTADSDNSLDEIDESNNTLLKDFEISDQGGAGIPVPDIALKEIRLIPASPLLYEAPVVKVVLANAGTEELPEVPLTLLWKLTKSGASRPLKEQGCSGDFTKLAPGEVREITAEYIQFWPSEPGDYTLRVELALGGVLLGLEKKLENNAGTVDFTVGPGEKPDIVVTRLGFNPPSPAKDAPFWIEAEVKNVGKGTVTNISARTRIFKAGVMIKENTQGSTSTYRTGATTSIRTLVDPGLPAGQYQIEVTADSDSSLDETDESNNTLSQVLEIGAPEPAQPPVITLFSAEPTSVRKGEAATLRWETKGGTSAVIDNGMGPVPAGGSRPVTPEKTTSYTLTVEGAGGKIVKTATVTVTATTMPGMPPRIKDLKPMGVDQKSMRILRPLFAVPSGCPVEIRFEGPTTLNVTVYLAGLAKLLGNPPQIYQVVIEQGGRPVLELGSFGGGRLLPDSVKTTVLHNDQVLRQARKLALILRILDSQKKEVYRQTIALTAR